jgi:transcriptional regulator with XRE-family HTH domain
MATTLAPVDSREVLRCDACHLVQFRTHSNQCRRCHKSLDADEPEVSILAPTLEVDPANAPGRERSAEGPSVARAIRMLRQRAGMSQRQLAARMQVPRTYVSKIENEKAMPTLSSLQRLAVALRVSVPDLLRGGELTLQERTRDLVADPFMAQLMPYLTKLDTMQRATLVGELKTMALRSRRSA